MQIITNYTNNQQATNNVIALGNFDGLHLGHQQIINKLKAVAKEQNLQTSVMSFTPHPAIFFKGVKNLCLFSTENKIQFLEQAGIDNFFLINFTQEFANLSATEFLEEVLIKQLSIKHIVVGHDFIFGKGRSGNAEFLQNNATKYGYGFTQVAAYEHAGSICSSSNVRRALKEGRVELAAQLLGKKYFIEGEVITGNNLGQELGFCTANIKLNDLFRPKYGVYAVDAYINNQPHKAVANLGIRPSIDDNQELLEVHIFDFSDNLYGKKIKIEFKSFLRDEKKFENLEDLKQQIAKDCATAKAL